MFNIGDTVFYGRWKECKIIKVHADNTYNIQVGNLITICFVPEEKLSRVT